MNGAKIIIVASMMMLAIPSLQADPLSDKEKLGRLLYFDQDLSINKNQACASCHLPPGFADPDNMADPENAVVSLGSFTDRHGGRNAPTASYAAFSPLFRWDPEKGRYFGGQFWDGRAATLTAQAKGPFLNPVEMAMPSMQSVLDAVADEDNSNHKAYSTLFLRVYDIELESLLKPKSSIVVDAYYTMIAEAIATFEKGPFFSKFNSRYDFYLAGKGSLTDQELSGLALFDGKAMCNACHASAMLTAPDGSPMPPLFTGFGYDNIGIPKSSNELIGHNPVDLGLGGRADIAANDPDGKQLGKFKISNLRNVAITAPYGHNGFFATLEDIVHFYNTRDVEHWPVAEVPENMNDTKLGNLGLTEEEEADIVAFMKTLTDQVDQHGPFNFPFLPAP